MSEKSKSTGVKCVSDNSKGGKSGVTRTSSSDKPQYFVDVVRGIPVSSLHTKTLGGFRQNLGDVTITNGPEYM